MKLALYQNVPEIFRALTCTMHEDTKVW